jgi:L-glyceraldehyde 3-phosphate reductase
MLPTPSASRTSCYLKGIPEGSRADKPYGALKERDVTDTVIEKVKKLSAIAEKRGQTMAQMALAWVLRNGKVTSALIGASRPEQIIENVKAVENLNFSEDELKAINDVLA